MNIHTDTTHIDMLRASVLANEIANSAFAAECLEISDASDEWRDRQRRLVHVQFAALAKALGYRIEKLDAPSSPESKAIYAAEVTV